MRVETLRYVEDEVNGNGYGVEHLLVGIGSEENKSLLVHGS